MTDSAQVPRGKDEKELLRLKKRLKFSAYNQLEVFELTIYLLHNGSVSFFLRQT